MPGRTGLVAVVGEEARVAATQHGEVQVQRDVVELLGVQAEDVVHGAVEAILIGSPEHEPHRVVHRRQRAQLQRVSSTAATPDPLSLMPGPSTRAIEMRADHHHVVRRAGLGLRQHVS